MTQIQRVADRDQAWRMECPELLGLAAWALADQIWRVCAAHGRRPSSLAEHWARVDGLRPRDMILQALWTGATAMPSISAARLIANGVGFALGDRQSEIPAADIARHLSRLALEAERQGHPMGPLSQAPDASETWLADVSPYIWTVDGSGVEEAGRSLVADYPGLADNTSLAIRLAKAPRTRHPACSVGRCRRRAGTDRLASGSPARRGARIRKTSAETCDRGLPPRPALLRTGVDLENMAPHSGPDLRSDDAFALVSGQAGMGSRRNRFGASRIR